MKKSICILLAIAMILGGVGGVPAEAATSYEQQAEEYAKSVLADYLRIDGNAYDTVYITQGYPVNDAPDDNQRIFFVVDGDSYIAQLRVSYVDGKFCSSFMFDDNADIEAAIDSSTPFALAAADKSIVVQTAKKTTSVISLPQVSVLTSILLKVSKELKTLFPPKSGVRSAMLRQVLPSSGTESTPLKCSNVSWVSVQNQSPSSTIPEVISATFPIRTANAAWWN